MNDDNTTPADDAANEVAMPRTKSKERFERAMAGAGASSDRLARAFDRLDDAVEACDAVPIRELSDDDSLVLVVDEQRVAARAKAER